MRLLGGFELDQARIAADLAQFEQGFEHDEMAAIEPEAGEFLAHFLVERKPHGFVEIALRAFKGDAADDLGLGRQVLGHLALGAAEQEGRDAARKPGAPLFIALTLDGCAVEALEFLLAAEQAGHQEVVLAPQLAEVVFQRRAGEAEPVFGDEFARNLGGGTAAVLDVLRLVENHELPALARKQVFVKAQQGIGGEHDIRSRNSAEMLLALGTVQREHAEAGREFLRLAPPVAHQAGGGNH